MEEAQRIYGHRADLTLCGTKEAALSGADALVIVTEWQAFRVPDFEVMKEHLKEPTIFDGRNMYGPARMAENGFTYYSVGRPSKLTLKEVRSEERRVGKECSSWTCWGHYMNFI